MAEAGFLVGALFGEGVLLRGGKAVAYYNTVAASYGLQAGVQKYGYAFIFDHKGLMAGLGLQGTKITKLEK